MLDEEQRRYTLLIWIAVMLVAAVSLAGLGWLVIGGLRLILESGHPLIAAVSMGMALLIIPATALLLLRPLVRRLDERPHIQHALWMGALTVLMALTPLLMLWMVWLMLRG